MKTIKFLCLSIALGFCSGAFSQDEWDNFMISKTGEIYYFGSKYNDDYFDKREGLLTSKERAEAKVKEVVLTSIDKKGKTSKVLLSYNKYGKIVSSQSKKYQRTSIYLNDTLEVERNATYRGKNTISKRGYVDGKLSFLEKYEKGKLVLSQKYEYENNKISKFTRQGKHKNTEMRYAYHENGKTKKTEYYKNGKLKKTWNYECKPEGELMASTRNEIVSSRCDFREESADGSYVLFTRTITKGEPFLNKSYYSKDSVLYKSESFKKDTILTYSWTKMALEFKSISYKKGKVKSQLNYYYDANGNEVSRDNFRKKKHTYRTESTYDSNSNLLSDKTFSRPKKTASSETIFEYNADNTVKTRLKKYKGKLYNTYTYEYMFY